MRLSWGVRTDRGRVRSLNEDAVLASPPVFVVADGMGGHAAGEVASGLVVEAFKQLAADAASPEAGLDAEDVVALLDRVNGEILDYGEATPAARGLGTTVAGLALVANGGRTELLAFNIGDSRLYQVDGDQLRQVSVDHSAVQELLDGGAIDADQVALHPQRHVVTRALGSDPGPRPDLWFLAPTAGDRFVLCSDGLTGEVDQAGLSDAVLGEADPAVLAHRLVEMALQHGGRDNVSVVVVDVVDAGTGEDAERTVPRASVTDDVATTQPRAEIGEDPADPPPPAPEALPLAAPSGVAEDVGEGMR
ncbi:MAG: protein phosphatase 2C domain-containing protein [Kineosporiaceae bacterium]